MNTKDNSTCLSCGNTCVTDYKRGRILCQACGVVKEERFIDPTSEYRFFMENPTNRNDPRRVGNIVAYYMDSQIDLIDIDQGKVSYHNYATQSTADKQFQNANKFIKRFCDLLDLRESIIKTVEGFYYDIQDKQELKGKRQDLVIAACIFLACKKNHVNVPPASLEPLVNCS